MRPSHETMKIHFCDLCNESVPQSELDEGRAFMRKGRVVCVRCDQLMTQREASSAAEPFAAPAHQAPSASPLPQQSVLTPLPVAPDGGFSSSAHAPPHHHHVPTSHLRAQRSGSGVAVGLFAMGLTICAFYWLTEQSQKASTDVQKRLADMKTEQQAADSRAMERSSELRGELLALGARLDINFDNEHKAVETRLAEIQKKFDLAQESMTEVRGAIEGLKSAVPSLQRHDQELNASAQKLAQLEGRANTLETAMVDMKKQLEERPSPAATPTAPATPVGTPPWMGLVQQLESANSGDRWVAVQSLGETRDPAVAEYILPRLKDVDIFVRMVAARVLGDLGSPKAIGALIEALNDQDAAVREASYLALCTVSKKSLPFDPHQEPVDRAKKVKVWQDWWKKAQEEGAAQ